MFVFRRVFSQLIRLVKGKSHKLGSYHEEKVKNEFALKNLAYTVPFLTNRKHFFVFTFSDDFELLAWLVTPLNFKPITSPFIWKIHYSNLCIRFDTWGERRMNQLPLQHRIVRQTLSNLLLFAAPSLTWFKRRSSAVRNSSVRLGAWMERRLERALNQLITRNKSQTMEFHPRQKSELITTFNLTV